jgi:hypothetical protein
MPRVFDTVIVASEADLDLLEARFTELADLDVVHVIAEAPVDWQGNPKPLWFWENAYDTDGVPGRFARWHGRWNHVRAEPYELPAQADAKARKDALREYLAHATCAEPDDVILHGGIDEVPAEWAVREIAEEAGTIALPVALEMRWCAYDAGRVHPLPWRGTVAHTWRHVGSFAGLREKRTTLPAVVGAGTRLSMWGQEGDRAVHPDGHALWEAVPDGTWPRWVTARTGEPGT